MLLRLLLVVTVVVASLVMFPLRSDACSCADIATSERFEGATRVFSGVVTSTGPGGFGTIQFDVVTVWKGPESLMITVQTGDNTPDCSGYPFDVGIEYLVFESKWRGWTSVGQCSGTRPVAYAASEIAELDALVEEAEGEGIEETETMPESDYPNGGGAGLADSDNSTSLLSGLLAAASFIALLGLGALGFARRRL